MGKDRILLTGLQYFSRHGAWEHEKLHGQKFIVDVELCGSFAAAGQSDDLADALDYTVAYQAITAVMQGRGLNLLEALGHRVACALLETFPAVEEVGVKVMKPGASLGGIAGSVAVEVWRDRHCLGSGLSVGYVSLGSNLGDRGAFLSAAVALMADSEGLCVTNLSGIYETVPVGKIEQPDFLNAVAEVGTTLSPRALLARLQAIETSLGRVRTEVWGPRTLDADIIYLGGCQLAEADLTIPHPRAHERSFVMAPLAAIAPGVPIAGKAACELALELGHQGVRLTAMKWSAELLGRLRPKCGGSES